jgi:hypothetical protein
MGVRLSAIYPVAAIEESPSGVIGLFAAMLILSFRAAASMGI